MIAGTHIRALLVLCFGAAFGLASPALAQSVTIDALEFVGTGCRPGTTTTIAVGGAVNIQFADYFVENMVAGRIDTDACAIIVTVNVPPGVTKVATKTVWEGATDDLNGLEFATFKRTLDFEGGLPEVEVSLFGTDQAFQLTDEVDGVAAAGCGGGKAQLKIGSLLSVKGAAEATISAADITFQVVSNTPPRRC
jgi:hypothetical protein